METLTRNKAAKKLKTRATNLLYWEKLGVLKPKRTKVGDLTLIIYAPELLEKARKILSRDNRRKKEK